MGEDKHVFKNSIKTVSGALKMIIGMAFLAFILGMIIVMLRDKVEGDFIYLFNASRIYSIIIFVVLVGLMYLASVDYIVSPQDVQFVRRGKVVQCFPFASCDFSSHIVQTTDLNSGISSKQRFLMVDNGTKAKKWPIALSKKNYDTFMAVVSNYQNKHAELENSSQEG